MGVLTYDLVGNRTMRDLLDERATATPDKSFIVFEDAEGRVEELTYQALVAQVDGVAAGFAEMGIGHGDKVTVLLRNCPELVISWFALGTLGAVMVPANTANTASEMQHVLSFSHTVAVITEPVFVATVEAAREECPAVKHMILVGAEATTDGSHLFADLARCTKPFERPDVSPDDVTELIFTSGTTALPKAVMLTHANALHAGERSARLFALDRSDRLVTVLPLFHVNAQTISFLPALTVGGTFVLVQEFSATKYWEQIRRHEATHTCLVAMLVRTMSLQPPSDEDRAHCLRRVGYALNIPVEEKEAFEQRFGVELINAYGLSEAMTIVAAAPIFAPRRYPSIGLPAHDRRVRIVDDAGNDVPTGEVGELLVHGVPGRTLMKGYYKDPDATARVLRDGWLHTGDNAYADELGYLYFFDRQKDMIKRAGENVSASEVETVLARHPEIAEAAVIGVPDDIRDEAVKAIVVRTDGSSLSEDEVREHCRQHLASFKVPTIVEFRDALPKTSVGKIEKKLLRAE